LKTPIAQRIIFELLKEMGSDHLFTVSEKLSLFSMIASYEGDADCLEKFPFLFTAIGNHFINEAIRWMGQRSWKMASKVSSAVHEDESEMDSEFDEHGVPRTRNPIQPVSVSAASAENKEEEFEDKATTHIFVQLQSILFHVEQGGASQYSLLGQYVDATMNEITGYMHYLVNKKSIDHPVIRWSTIEWIREIIRLCQKSGLWGKFTNTDATKFSPQVKHITKLLGKDSALADLIRNATVCKIHRKPLDLVSLYGHIHELYRAIVADKNKALQARTSAEDTRAPELIQEVDPIAELPAVEEETLLDKIGTGETKHFDLDLTNELLNQPAPNFDTDDEEENVDDKSIDDDDILPATTSVRNRMDETL
jgi:hypothetical protein